MRCGNKGKKSFETEEDAEEHRTVIQKKDPEATRLQTYFCPYCWKWHVGNKPIHSKNKSRRKRT